jgi:hypothetical protein
MRPVARTVLAHLTILAGFWPVGCTLDRSGSLGVADCGNGAIGASEDCDGDKLGGQDCAGLGRGAGELSCTAECTFDTSGCACGNGVIDPQEHCDGVELGALDCSSQGLGAGTLSCTDQCKLDTSDCSCGNGVIDAQEQCDGAELGGQDCVSQGSDGGTLTCTESCTFDRSGCAGCGNGIKDPDEPCEDTDFGGLSCDGGLVCTEECLVDASNCTLPSTGDGSDGLLTVSTTVNLNQTGAPAYAVTGIANDRVQIAGGPPALTSGDEVILISMQGGGQNCGSVGTYEFLEVSSVGSAEVVFQSNVQGGYGAGGNNADITGQSVVLQRVPHYSTMSISAGGVLTANAWNGATGGLMVMRVSQELIIQAGGSLSADGLGYRGGLGHNAVYYAHGRQGESICGDPLATTPTPNDGGGGGGKFMDPGNGCGQGGGGGGYGLIGTWKAYAQSCIGAGNSDPGQNGGGAYGTLELSQLLMGSGAGSGATDESSGYSGTGGAGGGLVMIFAAQMTIHGTVGARGAAGAVAPISTYDSGNGGGGSGGAIYLLAGELEGNGGITAEGGLGAASQHGWNSPGGDGAIGRLRVDYHHANGHLFGTAAATSYVTAMATPEPGHAELYHQ